MFLFFILRFQHRIFLVFLLWLSASIARLSSFVSNINDFFFRLWFRPLFPISIILSFVFGFQRRSVAFHILIPALILLSSFVFWFRRWSVAFQQLTSDVDPLVFRLSLPRSIALPFIVCYRHRSFYISPFVSGVDRSYFVLYLRHRSVAFRLFFPSWDPFVHCLSFPTSIIMPFVSGIDRSSLVLRASVGHPSYFVSKIDHFGLHKCFQRWSFCISPFVSNIDPFVFCVPFLRSSARFFCISFSVSIGRVSCFAFSIDPFACRLSFPTWIILSFAFRLPTSMTRLSSFVSKSR